MCGDSDVANIMNVYSSTSFKPPSGQYTVAASFFLTCLSLPGESKVISLATGTKCLPANRLPLNGEALHDSHAEVLARRGAIRWFLEEIGRCQSSNLYQSKWIHICPGEKYHLCEGVQVNLYVSTAPCGDASMRLLAYMQDEEMATLKDSGVYPVLSSTEASRGRDNYSRLGVLRTKPGRADSPQTLCMSCSDKIASWTVLGFQGALASHLLGPLYLSTIVIGGVPSTMQGSVKEDCERALCKRLEQVHEYGLQIPTVKFTTRTFIHSRMAVEATQVGSGSCNESLCWIADSKLHEVLINGVKRGVSPKHRLREKSRPQLSKMAMFQLYSKMGLCPEQPTATYYEVKRSILDYQAVKEKLMGSDGPFCGWIRSGPQWGSFSLSQEEKLQHYH